MSEAALRVCIVHNRYQQYGGEDAVVEAESALLREHGHEVTLLEQSNDDVAQHGALSLAIQAHWSRASVARMGRIVREFKPDVVHVHNTVPLISPSVIWAARRHGVPVVQTLHNFRLTCLNGFLLREQKICEKCVGRVPVWGVMKRCYRGSLPASAVLASVTTVHRLAHTYTRAVDRFIALSQFNKDKMIEAGLPADRISIKSNFVRPSNLSALPRSGIVYVGRLSEEKGIRTLAKAMTLAPELQLKVIGQGPLQDELARLPNVTLLGHLSEHEVRHHVAQAEVLVVPSIWYETPRTIFEAFAESTPVVASRLGPMQSLVQDRERGILFEPDDPADLAAKLRLCIEQPILRSHCARNALSHYETFLSPAGNYTLLRGVYAEAIDQCRRRLH